MGRIQDLSCRENGFCEKSGRYWNCTMNPSGWKSVGAVKFYRAKTVNPAVVLAAFLPNTSVLHLVGWDDPPDERFPAN